MRIYKIVVILIFTLTPASFMAQNVIDQVIAVVGDEPILKSEIETQALQMQSQGYISEGDINCELLEEMLFQKLLLKQAKQDSIEITSAEVDNELNRRLGVFIRRLGSEQKLEEYYQKSIPEIKADFRDMIKEQMLTQRMQQQITSDVSMTPAEVREYFNNIPEDSLPLIPTSYTLKQIVMYPKVSDEEKQRCRKKISEMRDRILDGENFSTLAVLYSDDPGSAAKGGELGFVSRTDLVPEFASTAFDLEPEDTVSRIIETEFGFHILKLIEKKGNLVNVRHILVTPRTGVEEQRETRKILQDIRGKIIADSISFEEAAETYSEDESTASSGGTMMNMQTGKTTFAANELDPLARDVIEELEPGELSKVIKTRDARGKPVLKFFKLQKKVPQHQANMKDDYQRYQEEALAKKKQNVINDWINRQLKSTYVKIDDSYQGCEFKYADWNMSK
jgi:peptidyl-prolyl cis-trans isomerase SurA